jgi:hypothetical protein
MANKKSLDLIKLEVLGCINENDRENLRQMKETEEDFPWKELAEYQNLVALLPSSLTVKYPESELKDKTAMKLYNIRDEIKAKLDEKILKDAPVQTLVEENPLVEEQPSIDAAEEEFRITGEEKIVEEREEIPVQKNIPEKTEAEILPREPEIKETPLPKPTIDKEMVEKITREYVKSHYARELAAIQTNINTNKILTIAFFVVTLILIALLFVLK